MQHLLFLTHRIPYPPNKGDKLRSFHMLRYLSEHYRVHLGCFVDDADDLQHRDEVRKYCGETHFAHLSRSQAKLRCLHGLFTGEPLSIPYYRDTGLQTWVDSQFEARTIKHIVVFSSPMAQYVRKRAGARRIADMVDIDSDKWTQYSRGRIWPFSAIYQREGKKLLAYERIVAREFDSTTFVSELEAGMFRSLAPSSEHKITHFNNGVDCEHFSPAREYPNPYAAEERVIVFTGAMDYWPNVDAVCWFAHKVFPAVHRRFPQAKFYIAGSNPARAVTRLAGIPGVVVTGKVEDMRPYLAHAQVAVAPLRVARGVQNKILEAMAMEKPVVASAEAAAALHVRLGEELHAAKDRNEWVALVLSALYGETRTMGVKARERILSDYSWGASLNRLGGLLKGLRALSGNPSPAPARRYGS
jgi:sugar transferase (PEP-CTERM/EpsH1 system associated)